MISVFGYWGSDQKDHWNFIPMRSFSPYMQGGNNRFIYSGIQLGTEQVMILQKMLKFLLMGLLVAGMVSISGCTDKTVEQTVGEKINETKEAVGQNINQTVGKAVNQTKEAAGQAINQTVGMAVNETKEAVGNAVNQTINQTKVAVTENLNLTVAQVVNKTKETVGEAVNQT